MVAKKLTDWLAGLVSEIPKRTSANYVRLVNLTALTNFEIKKQRGKKQNVFDIRILL